MNISDLISGGIGSTITNAIAQKLNIDPNKAKWIVSAAVPLIIAAINYNAKNKNQESNISNALDNHSGGILGNLAGLISPGVSNDGSKILGHVFGKNEGFVTQELSQKSGISTAQVGSILAMVAPVVMGMLGQQKQAQSGGGVGDLIGGLLGGGQSQSGGGGLLGSLIGSVLGGGAPQRQSSGGDLGGLMDLAGVFFNQQKPAAERENVLDSLAGLFGK